MGEFLLNIVGIEKEFPGVKALDNVNISVQRGDVHALWERMAQGSLH